MTIANYTNLSEVQPEEMVVNCAEEDATTSPPEDRYDEVPPEEPPYEQQRTILRDATRAPLACGAVW